ncbi:MAG: hypothetical protein M9949_11860 [Candidatus Kapabacteria bacterium]|nr:hypothetical protein [Candidatus Kapabacteria bacterium]
MKIRQYLHIPLALMMVLLIASCSKVSNFSDFTTYYNTFYNMERLMWECEDEFDFQEDKKRIEPRIFVPQPEFYVQEEYTMGPPPFLTEFIINKQQRQPVRIKLDSIVIKGSKILAHKPRGSYIEGSLWLMAKTFFYQEDWLNSQVKCSELIDKFQDGELSPDAHLLYSKNLHIQRQYEAGALMLSRTVDIAWQKKRYDILSEAFRIEAELALMNNDLEKALRPYRQAIVQSEEGALKARWQLDMAALLYRKGDFVRSEEAFRKVADFSPNYLQRFEAHLYRAGSLARLGRFDESFDLLNRLYNDGKYEEWQAFTAAQLAVATHLRDNDSTYVAPLKPTDFESMPLVQAEKLADSLLQGNGLMLAHHFEKGVLNYNNNKWKEARQDFAKAKVKRTPVFRTADRMFELMNNWDLAHTKVNRLTKEISAAEAAADSVKVPADSLEVELCDNYFKLGRVHEELNNPDSVITYYQYAAENAPLSSSRSAMYLYAYARVIRESDPFRADSLLDVIVETHPLTEYGKDAQLQLGYTNSFVIDTVADLYSSGVNLMRVRDFKYAINQFTNVFAFYPSSKYAPKSLYTIGWIFEKHFELADSALYYYKLLIDNYPLTEYAEDVRLGVSYKLVLSSGEEIPDSLKERQAINPIPVPMPVKGRDPQNRPTQKLDIPERKGLDPMQIMRDPGSILNNPEGLIQNPLEVIKNFELPTSPMELLSPTEEGETPTDTTNVIKFEPPE